MNNIEFTKGTLKILDQTLLPNEEKWVEISTKEQAYYAIKSLQVRGAPAIGIFAAAAMAHLFKSGDDIYALKEYLDSSRPTAVNLSWATACMTEAYEKGKDLFDCAKGIYDDDVKMCKKISEYGLSLIGNNATVLTHCNAGELATSKYGTGLGPLILGAEKGYNLHAYVDETRPLLQGARLTSYELEKAGVDTTLICDNMASIVMKQGLIDAMLVGCDRVAMNGDTANKIGTSAVAITAKYYNVPFYVLGPTSTFDKNSKTGDDIVIEQRDGDEIKNMFFTRPTALSQTKCYNPAFDVTPNELITAIVTDKGIIKPPYDINIKAMLFESSGDKI